MDRVKRIWYYHLCEQRRFRRACASMQSGQNLRCSLIQAVSQEEPSDRKPDTWPLWMTGHAQLKFVMTECSKTQIRLTGLILLAMLTPLLGQCLKQREVTSANHTCRWIFLDITLSRQENISQVLICTVCYWPWNSWIGWCKKLHSIQSLVKMLKRVPVCPVRLERLNIEGIPQRYFFISLLEKRPAIIWARSCENMSYVMCNQQRHRSACASDQHLCCSLLR